MVFLVGVLRKTLGGGEGVKYIEFDGFYDMFMSFLRFGVCDWDGECYRLGVMWNFCRRMILRRRWMVYHELDRKGHPALAHISLSL